MNMVIVIQLIKFFDLSSSNLDWHLSCFLNHFTHSNSNVSIESCLKKIRLKYTFGPFFVDFI